MRACFSILLKHEPGGDFTAGVGVVSAVPLTELLFQFTPARCRYRLELSIAVTLLVEEPASD